MNEIDWSVTDNYIKCEALTISLDRLQGKHNVFMFYFCLIVLLLDLKRRIEILAKKYSNYKNE